MGLHLIFSLYLFAPKTVNRVCASHCELHNELDVTPFKAPLRLAGPLTQRPAKVRLSPARARIGRVFVSANGLLL